MKIFLVTGARPNFMKIKPLLERIREEECFHPFLVHTGQHYDQQMSEVFFQDLCLPQPDVYLGVGGGSRSGQVAKIMRAFETVCVSHKPALVIVVGDVNSTLAASLAAAHLGIPLAHVEAGLRSFDRNMPEEINRAVTDSLSDYCFTTCRDADENLKREGIPEEKIFFVGNVMVDTLLAMKEKARTLSAYEEFEVQPRRYFLLTLHRPSNVDHKEVFIRILEAAREISKTNTVIFPAHLRTRKQITLLHLQDYFFPASGIKLIDPLSYTAFVSLMLSARGVLTDSGGVQEETTALGIPCLTLRENTERPVTIHQGTNILVGTEPGRIIAESRKIMVSEAPTAAALPLWDGYAAQRIVRILKERMNVISSLYTGERI